MVRTKTPVLQVLDLSAPLAGVYPQQALDPTVYLPSFLDQNATLHVFKGCADNEPQLQQFSLAALINMKQMTKVRDPPKAPIIPVADPAPYILNL